MFGVFIAVPVLVVTQYPLFNTVEAETQPAAAGRPEPAVAVELM